MSRPLPLRLMLVTDGSGDVPRLLRTVRAAVEGGVRCVQVREPSLSARQLADVCGALYGELDAVGGLLLVNDRIALAASGDAHGVHLGQRSLPASATRRIVDAVRPGVVVGVSVHDEAELRAAEGADFVALSPVFPTRSHPGAPTLGVEGAAALMAKSPVPAVWLGGIDVETLREFGAHRPAGVAVMRAITDADDPRAAAATLDRALRALGM